MTLTLCIEQTLGHRTHTLNIESAVAQMDGGVDVVRVEFGDGRSRMPWTVRASLAARRELRSRAPSEVTLFHTQAVSLFARSATRGGKYVVSLDATPRQMDEFGHWYAHRRHLAPIEWAKDAAYRRVLNGASALVAWTEWTKASLVRDYGQPAGKIAVISPGAGPEFFAIERHRVGLLPRILFVGGDFERKGGSVLLEAFARLRDVADLTLVTTANVGPVPGVNVVSNATPGSSELRGAYAEADIFCLPTLADCAPIALLEGMAAGLAVVATTVGANSTTVRDGDNAILIQPGSVDALAKALGELAGSSTLRTRLGKAARMEARTLHDAQRNTSRLLMLMSSL